MLSHSEAGRRRPASSFPWISATICVLATLAYVLAASELALPGVTGDGPVDFENALHVVGLGGRSTPLIADAGESWRLWSCHFVHTSTLHLVFNLAFLFSVGGALEQVTRRADYAALIIFVGTAAAMASLLGTPQVSAGASGLVFGTLGAAVSFGMRHNDHLGKRVQRYFGLWVLPFLLVLFGIGIGNPTVDHASHLGGLIAGLAAGVWLPLPPPDDEVYEVIRGPPISLFAALLFTCTAMLAAPSIIGANSTDTVELEGGAIIQVPSRWHARYGPSGEAEFSTAADLVVLTADQISASRPIDAQRWYEGHALGAEVSLGNIRAVRVQRSAPLQTQLGQGRWVRYRLERNGTAMVRDVHLIVQDEQEIIIVALETPAAWASKYNETRLSILGSMRMTSNSAHRNAAAAP